MGISALGGFYHLVDNMGGGRLIGVTHAEIDNIFARGPGLLLQVADNIENIRGEAFNTPKLVVHVTPGLLSAPDEARSFKKVANSTESAPNCQRSSATAGNIDAIDAAQ